MTPTYYLGRLTHVFRARSHPVNYIYMWVREESKYHPEVKVLRLAHTDAYWRR